MAASCRLAPHPGQHRTSSNSLQRHGDSYVTGSAFQQEHDPYDTPHRFSRQHWTKTSLKKHVHNGKTTCNGTNKTTEHHYLNETKGALRNISLQLNVTTATIQLHQDRDHGILPLDIRHSSNSQGPAPMDSGATYKGHKGKGKGGKGKGKGKGKGGTSYNNNNFNNSQGKGGKEAIGQGNPFKG